MKNRELSTKKDSGHLQRVLLCLQLSTYKHMHVRKLLKAGRKTNRNEQVVQSPEIMWDQE